VAARLGRAVHAQPTAIAHGAGTLLQRLTRQHPCGAAPSFEQLSSSTDGHRTFRCGVCSCLVVLKNRSAL
jgi:hypothetical protein